MASSNLLPNLYTDRMFVNRLRTLALKANEIQSNDIVDLDADEELKKLLSEYVQLLLNTDNDYENATNNLLQPAVMKGTMQMTNGYINGYSNGFYQQWIQTRMDSNMDSKRSWTTYFLDNRTTFTLASIAAILLLAFIISPFLFVLWSVYIYPSPAKEQPQ